MKKILTLVSLSFILVLAACGGNDNEGAAANDDDTIVIGASSVPHGEILEEAEPLLEKEGIELEIEPYEDFVLPNDDLDSGEIDANFFQHIPYLEQTNEDPGYNLVNIGGIHIEPMGVYSQGFDSVDDVPDGTEEVLSNSVADHGRVLSFYEEEGLIEVDDSVDADEATIAEMDEDSHNLEVMADNEAGSLPDIYESEDDALVVINTYYAIEARLDPQTDTLSNEGYDSPYVNVVAVDEECEANEA